MPIFTTRGCPYSCKFCSVTRFFGRTYRVKPVANVIAELESTKAIDYFFVDDNIAGDVDYARELFSALANMEQKLVWMSQISTAVIKHPELLEMASKAGCGCLYVGIESITDANLKSVRKSRNNVEEYEELFQRLTKAGIVTFASVILGLDHDTEERIRETLDFLIRNKVTMVSFFILTPMPGTDLFEEMREAGRILHTDWHLYDLNHVVFKPKLLTPEALTKSYWDAFQGFFTMRNVLRRMSEGRAIYANSSRKKPSRALDLLFFQLFYRNTVKAFEHPFSGGIRRKR
jgi:radical SAM superfamily enzyme YgiQ (UPF0313 family)